MTTRRTDVRRWSWGEVCARRLDRHALLSPAEGARPSDIVSSLGAVHAQVLSAAELSVGLRIAGATRADVRIALWIEHSLIKTYGPRGTVHLLSAQDLSMWTGALVRCPRSSVGGRPAGTGPDVARPDRGGHRGDRGRRG